MLTRLLDSLAEAVDRHRARRFATGRRPRLVLDPWQRAERRRGVR